MVALVVSILSLSLSFSQKREERGCAEQTFHASKQVEVKVLQRVTACWLQKQMSSYLLIFTTDTARQKESNKAKQITPAQLGRLM